MKTQRFVTILTILTICTFSLGWLSSAGCNKGKSKTNQPDPAQGSEDVSFAERNGGSPQHNGWLPISATVLGQIQDNYEGRKITLQSLERSDSGSPAIRLALGPRDGLPVEKELLDGLYILFENFPRQTHYVVEVARDGNPAVEAGWSDLQNLKDAGYSLDTPPTQVAGFWAPFDTDGKSSVGDGHASVETAGN
jgi:hypothetical protein